MKIVKLNGVASCESFIEGFGPENACSEDINSSWKAEPYFKWWIFDAQKICYVDCLNLILGNNGEYYHYHIEISADRINWQFLTEKNDDSISLAEGDLIRVCKKTRFIRITVSYCSNSSIVTIQNVSVYGYEDDHKLDNSDITKQRIKAVYADKVVGFEKKVDFPIEDNWNDCVIETNLIGSFIQFNNLDFGDGIYDQIRFCLGLPIADKALYLKLEFRIDGINGEKVGEIHLCRQYTYFTELAVELLDMNKKPVSGKHDLYIILSALDAPQRVLLYWVKLDSHPILSNEVMDYKDKLVIDNEPYQVFFGDNHCHTGLTDGYGTSDHAYDYARNVAKLDFLGITEHSNCLDEMFDCEKSFKWRELKKSAERATENGRFVGLYGSETTWYNQFGHMNIYCADFYINSYEFKYDDALTYYKKLKEYPGIISQWNHPWSCGKRHLDYFEPYDEQLDDITYTMELNNLELSGDDILKYYTIALDKGWHLSPVGNQDNHKEDWGTQNGMRTAVIARRLTAADIFDAMKSRRTYFSGIPGFRVLYSINNNIQGSIIEDADTLCMNVKASCDDKIDIEKIEVYGESGKVIDEIWCGDSDINIFHNLRNKQKYYFLKLIRKDGQIAVTAPIWIKA